MYQKHVIYCPPRSIINRTNNLTGDEGAEESLVFQQLVLPLPALQMLHDAVRVEVDPDGVELDLKEMDLNVRDACTSSSAVSEKKETEMILFPHVKLLERLAMADERERLGAGDDLLREGDAIHVHGLLVLRSHCTRKQSLIKN
jgi:translation elongation factor EF-1beta